MAATRTASPAATVPSWLTARHSSPSMSNLPLGGQRRPRHPSRPTIADSPVTEGR